MVLELNHRYAVHHHSEEHLLAASARPWLALAFVLAAAAVAPLGAQELGSRSDPRFGVAVGAAFATANFPGEYGPGLQVLGTVRVGTPLRRFALRVDLFGTDLRGSVLRDSAGRALGRFADQIVFSLSGNAVVSLLPPGTRPVVPYLIAGAGYYGNEFQSLGLNAGGGLLIRAGSTRLFLEARAHNIAAIDLSHRYRGPLRFASTSVGVFF